MKTGGWIDRCDVCKRPVDRASLRYRKAVWNHPPSQNYLLHSEYAAADWQEVGTGAASSTLSWGIFPEKRPSKCYSSADPTIIGGVTTFGGTLILAPIAADVVNVSAWTSLVFSVYISPFEMSDDPTLVIELGVCNPASPASNTPLWTVTTKALRRHWFTTTPAVVAGYGYAAASFCPYFKVTPVSASDLWFFERAALQKDVLTPTAADETNGTAVVYSVDTRMSGMAKACPKCAEDIPDDEERHPLYSPSFGEDRYESLNDVPEGDY